MLTFVAAITTAGCDDEPPPSNQLAINRIMAQGPFADEKSPPATGVKPIDLKQKFRFVGQETITKKIVDATIEIPCDKLLGTVNQITRTHGQKFALRSVTNHVIDNMAASLDMEATSYSKIRNVPNVMNDESRAQPVLQATKNCYFGTDQLFRDLN